jgi:hypothetical protein
MRGGILGLQQAVQRRHAEAGGGAGEQVSA